MIGTNAVSFFGRITLIRSNHHLPIPVSPFPSEGLLAMKQHLPSQVQGLIPKSFAMSQGTLEKIVQYTPVSVFLGNIFLSIVEQESPDPPDTTLLRPTGCATCKHPLLLAAELQKKLVPEFLHQYPSHFSIAYLICSRASCAKNSFVRSNVE